MYMNMNLNYSKKQQPVKLRGQPNDINQYIQTLKQKISILENKVSELSKTNQELVSENVTLKDKLDSIHKEKERKALETFKIQNAERKQRAEKIRAYLGHDYESDDDE